MGAEKEKENCHQAKMKKIILMIMVCCSISCAGEMIGAKCSCGFIDNHILVGQGKTRNVSMVPALCEKCRKIVSVNIEKKDILCEKCKGPVILYTDKKLQGKQLEFDSNIGDIIKLKPEDVKGTILTVLGVVREGWESNKKKYYTIIDNNDVSLIVLLSSDAKQPEKNEYLKIKGLLIREVDNNTIYFVEHERKVIKKFELVPNKTYLKNDVLPAIFYLCPKCNKTNIIFMFTGVWD